MAWLQASRTLGKNMACPARPALMGLNPVLFSSLAEFPGFEWRLPAAHTPLPAAGEAADHMVCLQTAVLAAGGPGAPMALHPGLGAVRSHPDSDLLWPEPRGFAATRWGVLSCFLAICRQKAPFAFPPQQSGWLCLEEIIQVSRSRYERPDLGHDRAAWTGVSLEPRLRAGRTIRGRCSRGAEE